MSLRDEAAPSRQPLRAEVILAECVSDEERAEVLDLLEGRPLLPHMAVSRTLSAHDKPISANAVRFYREAHHVAP